MSVSGGTLVCPANPPGTYPISGYIAYDEHYDGIGTPNGNIYESGIPGIGYRLWLEGSSVAVAGRYWPTIVRGLRWAGSFTINPHTMRVQLIRTGPISQGIVVGCIRKDFCRWYDGCDFIYLVSSHCRQTQRPNLCGHYAISEGSFGKRSARRVRRPKQHFGQPAAQHWPVVLWRGRY